MPSEIPRIVRGAQRIAVVGWSDDPYKPSNDIAGYCHEKGFDVVAVNPRFVGRSMYGNPVAPDLVRAGPVDVALIFRRSPDVKEHEQDALEAKVPVFWMQSGIRNEEVAARLAAQGVTVVQDRCFMVEHARLAHVP